MSDHGNIIADAAKHALQPLGFQRKGRSRTWIADHGWWLNVVEFQPSGWTEGSYLNVAAHWLWSDGGYLSFNFGGRIAGFEEYANDEQFGPSARRLAQAAAEEALKLTDTFGSMGMTADVLMTDEASLREEARGSWSAYNAGIAAALAGRESDAAAIFRSVSDERVKPAADRLTRLLSEPAKLKDEVASLIVRQRKALGLPELSGAPF
jgi:hypothetical protein